MGVTGLILNTKQGASLLTPFFVLIGLTNTVQTLKRKTQKLLKKVCKNFMLNVRCLNFTGFGYITKNLGNEVNYVTYKI